MKPALLFGEGVTHHFEIIVRDEPLCIFESPYWGEGVTTYSEIIEGEGPLHFLANLFGGEGISHPV